jgi:hypothetical protein
VLLPYSVNGRVGPVGDLVREYGRVAGLFAAAAFVLSLCIGLLSRNSFATALLRALLLALVFAGLGAGLKAVIRRWLPEMASLGAAGPASEGEGRAGQTVDIVLPGESYGASAESGGGAGAAREEAEEPAELAGEPEEAEEPAELTEEPEEKSSRPEGPLSTGEVKGEEDAPLESLYAEDEPPGTGQPAVPAGPDEGAPLEGPEPKPRGRSRAGRDALPDIAELGLPPRGGRPSAGSGSSKVAPGSTPGGTLRQARRAATPEEAMRGALGSEDPESLAKAIRTVLKRDERG